MPAAVLVSAPLMSFLWSTGVDRKTVKRWLRVGVWRPRQVQRRARQLDRFASFIERRGPEVGFNSAVLFGNCRDRVQLKKLSCGVACCFILDYLQHHGVSFHPAPTGFCVLYAERYAAFLIPAPDPQLSVIARPAAPAIVTLFGDAQYPADLADSLALSQLDFRLVQQADVLLRGKLLAAHLSDLHFPLQSAVYSLRFPGFCLGGQVTLSQDLPANR
jgi:hypothetical protein